MVKGPIKWILEKLPILQTCHAEKCACNKMHLQGPDGGEVIVDLWGRSFVDLRFQKASPEKADMFCCQARVICEVSSNLLKQSGQHGIYMEPRAIDGRRDDRQYHTIWLSNKTLSEARADAATAAPGAAFIRIGQHFGIRANMEDAASIHAQLKGSAPFLAGPMKMTWELSPLPWGTTRKSIQALLKGWNWKARPLKRAGRSSDGSGIVWQVMAVEDPKCTGYSLAHGDIVY